MPIPPNPKAREAHQKRLVSLMGQIRDSLKNAFAPINVGNADGFERHEQHPAVAQAGRFIQRMRDLDAFNPPVYRANAPKVVRDYIKWVQTKVHDNNITKSHPKTWKAIAATIEKLAEEIA